MKRLIIIVFISALIVTIFGCSNGTPDLTYGDYDQAEEEAKQEERQQLLDEIQPELEKMEEAGSSEAYAEQKVDEFMAILENNITGYSTKIPKEIYSTPADENGHGNTYYVLDGHLESFISAKDYMPESFSGEEYDSMYMADVTTPDGNEIVIYNVIIPTKDVSIENYKEMVGKDVRIWFEYSGFSEVKQVAMGLLHFMTDDPTGLRDLPIELDFNSNAAFTIKSMLEDISLDEAKVVSVGEGYAFEGSAQYVSDDESYKTTESLKNVCIDFFDKQGFVFVKGTLAFMKDDETVTQYEFNFDEIAVSSSSTKDNVDSLNNEDEPSTGNNQKLTLGKSNALDTALTYLSIGLGFSEKKLKEQLEYEGFLDDEVEYALDNCDANWNEQAVLAANGYLEVMPLSKQRLIEQLEYDGFTREQAEYGASKVGY